MNITEHEMRGLITGKAMPADIFVGESLAAYLVRKFTNLHTERDALAAENVALKESVEHAAGCIHAAEVEGLEDALESNDGERLADLIHRRLCHAHLPVVTPATDKYLNSVRADAVGEFAHQQRVIADSLSGDEQRSHRITACRAEDFAAKLRAGKDGE
ncbi:hypothetical protein [Pantoea agglomerans]|uniref:hypothetical protein n=1 Tax=Enterobacter agglomerans TaxID=549 RepID=UPI0013B77E81|nr:hypothetical protein [Pantoea agglomerans]NEG58015.1 hypothetical protein [Pantoea agglomerans]NEG99728.1 hypothetical protein [Pantoea agglomerans]NEH04309.1 hypothetical protein [Pantoea agglomerans]NEH14288.1 hypothetical protein [Pantoea agglomerans]